MKIKYGNYSALITSDILAGAQGRLINEEKEEIMGVSVMTAPYHGLGRGTSRIGIFLQTVNPDEIYIIGSNKDDANVGGTREPFIRLLNQYGMVYKESYKFGDIRIISDGQGYSTTKLN